jgi:thioesterase domain-containing protein
VTPRELESYLHQRIPLSAAMQVAVVEASPVQVVLSAPLAPNINHRDTLFGGSASAIALLAVWAFLHTRFAALGIDAHIVVRRNTMSYERAIAGDFTAKASAPPPEAWALFTRTLQEKGRARIAMSATLWYEDREAGRLEGEFVALASADA